MPQHTNTWHAPIWEKITNDYVPRAVNRSEGSIEVISFTVTKSCLLALGTTQIVSFFTPKALN